MFAGNEKADSNGLLNSNGLLDSNEQVASNVNVGIIESVDSNLKVDTDPQVACNQHATDVSEWLVSGPDPEQAVRVKHHNMPAFKVICSTCSLPLPGACTCPLLQGPLACKSAR